MYNLLFKKGFTAIIIVLFVVVSTVPAINSNSRELDNIKNNFDIIGARWNTGTTSKNILSNGEVFLPSSTKNIKNGNEPLGGRGPGPEDDLYNQSMFDVYEIAEFGQTAWGLTSADFNNDGNIDFAVSYSDSPRTYAKISIFYNDGTGVFDQDDVFTLSYDSYITSLDSADYDNDGDIDFLLGYSEYDEDYYNIYGVVCILFNDGSNNFGDETMIARLGAGIPFDPEARINPQVTSADYDNDGDIDFLVGDNSGKVEFYSNDGSGVFTSAGIIHDFGSFSWGLTSADYDGDGHIDFLVAAEVERPNGHVYLKLNSGLSNCFDSGSGDIIADIYNNPATASLTPIDYNKDGDLDFIAGVNIFAYLCINNLGIYNPFLIGYLPDSPQGYSDVLHCGGLTSADFNNDGWDDFVAGGVQGVVRLFINNYTQAAFAKIDRPIEYNYLYIFDEENYRPRLTKKTVILGKITVEAEAYWNVQKVEFYVDDEFRGIGTYDLITNRYTWLWDEPSFGYHTLKIVAYNAFGSPADEDEIDIWKFF